MEQPLTDNTKAILLLCGVFGNDAASKPLTQSNYTKLVKWMMDHNKQPKDLFDPACIIEAAEQTSLTRERLEILMNRGFALALALEAWHRDGFNVLSRSDTAYPSRIKKHLKDKAPPLLFIMGDPSLLEGGGLAIVGSRNVDPDSENFTRKVGDRCGKDGITVVSGGARGVDQAAMHAALEAGGKSICVLANDTNKAATTPKLRNAIAAQKLLLISPYHPNAGFNVGAAMGRNKLIYAMADHGLVVRSDFKKGGTWTGAIEELRRREHPRPLFVYLPENAPEGNHKLIEEGAQAWTMTLEQPLLEQLASPPPAMATVKSVQDEESPVYEAVLPLIRKSLDTPKTINELAQTLKVLKSQLSLWLSMAVEGKAVKKLTQPEERYIRA